MACFLDLSLAIYKFSMVVVGTVIMIYSVAHQWDTYNIFSCQHNIKSKIMDTANYMLCIHEVQLLVMIVRALSFMVFHPAASTVVLMKILLKRRVSSYNIKIYHQLKVLENIMRSAEVALSGSILGGAFVLIIFCVCTLFYCVKMKRTDDELPILVILCFVIFLIQIILIVGCVLFKLSTGIIAKWNKEAGVDKKNDKHKIYLFKVVRSLKFISVPASSVGVIDVEIRMNYMDNLLRNIVGCMLTMKEMLQ